MNKKAHSRTKGSLFMIMHNSETLRRSCNKNIKPFYFLRALPIKR